MSTRQAMIVGLGQFGTSLAQTLAGRGIEVLAIDSDASAVQALSSSVAEALTFDATDQEALRALAPQRRDLCVVAIGREARDAAIMVTASLRELGAPRIVARASDRLTERVLSAVGAHEVINPERVFGERLANRLVYEGVVEEFPLGEDLVISEIQPPKAIWGRELASLELPQRVGANVVAMRRVVQGAGRVIIPTGREVLRGDDILVVVSPPGTLRRLLEALA